MNVISNQDNLPLWWAPPRPKLRRNLRLHLPHDLPKRLVFQDDNQSLENSFETPSVYQFRPSRGQPLSWAPSRPLRKRSLKMKSKARRLDFNDPALDQSVQDVTKSPIAFNETMEEPSEHGDMERIDEMSNAKN